MAYQFDPNELTSEKSLLDVYKLSRRLSPSKFQIFAMLLTSLILAVNAFYFVTEDNALLNDVRGWAELGFNFSITTLGFLIAGFTIFATLSKPEMMLAMMAHKNKETSLPTLKYNFFAFMKVFIAYIFIAAMYLSIILFGQTGGFISNLIPLIPGGDCLRSILIKTFYVLVGVSFVYLLLLLQTYIFNIYSVVMNFLRWEHHSTK